MHKKSVLKSALQSLFVGFLLLGLMGFKTVEGSESSFTLTSPASITETDKTVCASSVLLNGNSPDVGETGLWTGPGGVTYTPNANSPTVTITNLNSGNNTFTWTLSEDIPSGPPPHVDAASVNIFYDDTDPTITCIGDQTKSADAGQCYYTVVGAEFNPSAFNDDDPNNAATISNDFNLGATLAGAQIPDGTTIEWTVTDWCGHTTTCTFDVAVNDNEAPAVGGSLTATTIEGCVVGDAPSAETTVAGLLALPGSLTTSDNCSANADITVSSIDAVAGTCPIVITRTYSLEDEAGNTSSSFNHVINVDDTTLPTFTAPADVTIYSDASCNYDVTVGNVGDVIDEADNCSVGQATFVDVVDTSDPCASTVTRTWSLVDDCSNAAVDQVQIITITDTIAPTYIQTCPADTLFFNNNLNSCDGFVTWTEPTYTDNCSAVTIVKSASPNNNYPVGDTTVTYTATDICGNSISCSFVVRVIDNQIPSITCIPSFPAFNEVGLCSANVIIIPPVDGDNCAVDSVYNDYNNTPNASDVYPVDTTIVNWTVVDIHGNTNTCSQEIIVVDNEAPEIVFCPNDTVTCDPVVFFDEPIFSDNCGYRIDIVDGWVPGSTFPAGPPGGSSVVTYVATDSAGLTATCSFDVFVYKPSEAGAIRMFPAGSDSIFCQGSFFIVELYALPSFTQDIHWEYQPLSTSIWQEFPSGSNTTLLLDSLHETSLVRAVVTHGVCDPAYSNEMLITIDEEPIGGTTLTEAGTNFIQICVGDSAIITLEGYSGDSLRWQSADASNPIWGDMDSDEYFGDSITVAPGNGTSTLYRVIVENGVCTPAISTESTVVVNSPPSAGEILPNDTLLCEGMNATFSSLNPSGSIQWQSSPYLLGAWTDIPGATSANLTLTAADSLNLRIIATSTFCPNDTSIISDVYVHPTIENDSIMSDQEQCQFFASDTLIGSQPTGGEGTSYNYVWESSLDLSTWGPANPINTNQNYAPGVLGVTTYFRRTIESGACVGGFGSISDTVTIDWFPAIGNNLISPDQDICVGDVPAIVDGELPNGGNGSYTYLWKESTDNMLFADASGINNLEDYQPGTLTQTMYYYRIVESAPCESASASYSDTIMVRVYEIPVANAGISDSSDVCGLTYDLDAIPSVGIGTWTSPDPEITFGDENSPTSSVSIDPGAYGVYTLTWTELNGVCSSSDSIVLTYYEIPIAYAGANDSICGLEYDLAAIPSGVWTDQYWIIPSGITIDDNSIPNAQITADAYQNYTLQWIEDNNGCTDTSEVEILFIEIPTNSAGTGGPVCGLQTTMTAELTNGFTGTWILDTNVTTPTINAPNAIMTADTQGVFLHIWEVVNNGCIGRDSVSIIYFENPVVDAGENQSICGLIDTLSGSVSTGNPIWSYNGPGTLVFSDVNDPESAVEADAYGDYTLYLSSNNGVCDVLDSLSITFNPTPSATILGSTTICQGEETDIDISFTGTAPFVFSYTDGSTITTLPPINANSYTLTVSPLSTTTYSFVDLVDATSCLNDTITGSVTIMVDSLPVINAGTDSTLCFNTIDSSYTLNGSVSIGTSQWTVLSAPGSVFFSDDTSPTSTITVDAYGIYELILTSSNGVCSIEDTLYLTLDEIPEATIAVNETTICIGSAAEITFTMTGVPPFEVVYNDGTMDHTISNISGLDTTISVFPIVLTNYSLVSVSSINTCSSTILGQSVSVDVDEMPMPYAGSDSISCWELTDVYQLNGSTDIGTTLWTFDGPGTATFADATDLNTTLQVDDFGLYSFILSSTNNTCVNSDTVEVMLNEFPTAFIGQLGDTVICEGETTFVEIEFTGTAPWGIIYNDGSGNDTITGIMSTPYQLDLTPLVTTTYTLSAAFDINQCESNEVSMFTITVYEMPIPVINTADTAVCGDQIVIEAMVPNAGTGQWSSDNTVTFLPDDTELSVVATTSQYGLHTLTWTITNNMCVESTSVNMNYQEAIPDGSSYAGPDQLLFFQFDSQMDAQLPGFAEGTWELISGVGNVVNENDPYTTINGLEYGVSTYLWTVQNGICPSVTDSVRIDVRPIQETSGFSPNGDGINDTYVINGLENTQGNEFIVFNNWGDVIYKATNYSNDWDGRGLNGKDLPSDTYYFVLKITGVGDYSGYLIIKR